MSNYPRWYCPVFACGFRSQYSKNIRRHLSCVHGWSSKDIDKVVESFFKAYKHNRKVVCGKAPNDPCYPSGFNEALTKGRRDLSRRSVSVRSVGGGGGVE